MYRKLTLIFASLMITGTMAVAQLEPVPLEVEYENQIVTFENSSSNQDIFEKNYVYSTLDEPMSITWIKIVDVSDAKEWGFEVCDKNLCYLESINSADFDMVEFDTSEMTVHLRNKGVEGDLAIVYVNLFRNDIDNSDSLYVKTTFESTTSTVNVVKRNDVTVYPNPAAQYFNIKSPANIGRVIVHDILGEKLMMLNLNGQHNKKIDISDLQSGTYFVSAFDTEGNRLKTTRLLKRSVSP